MKSLKLATLPLAVLATSAYANDVVVVEEPAQAGFIQNSATQVVDGTKTLFNKVTHPGAISAEIGTLGYGGHITWGVSPKVDLVAGWNGGDIDVDMDIDNDSIINWNKVLDDKMADFEGNIAFKGDMNNPYLGVRLRPWANNFNLNTGVIFNDNQFDVVFKATKDVQYTLNGTPTTLKADADITVSAEHRNSIAPYLTIGFAPSSSKRWGFFGELGAAYTGDIKTTVNYSVPPSVAGTPAENDVKAIADDVRAEIQDANFGWYPIAKAGVTVRF